MQYIKRQFWARLTAPRILILYCGLLGLIIPLWVIITYAPYEDFRAIFIVVLILMGFGFGINELWLQTTDIEQFQRELQELDDNLPAEEQFDSLSPALYRIVHGRLYEGVQVSSLRAPYTPYLIGALILLGLIGTFIGLVDTLSGTREALQSTAELETLRDSLLAPIAGLARAFGTSVSGVATSVVLGLAATLTRREESRLNYLVSGLAASSLTQLHPVARQTAALEKLVEQGTAVPSVLERFQDAVTGLMSARDDARSAQESLANHIAAAISEKVELIRTDLDVAVKRFGAEIEPAIKGILVHAAGIMDDAGKDLFSKVQARFDSGTQRDQEQREELLKLFQMERQARSVQELQHFDKLAVHAQELTRALQAYVETIGKHYSGYLEKLEQHVARVDASWRNDAESRLKEGENQRRALDSHLDAVRTRFTQESETLATQHEALLGRMNQHYQDLVTRFDQQASTFADHAAKKLSELSLKYADIVDRHEEDRQQLRKTWGIEQGRQQRQFDSMLEKMREDLEDRRRADTEQITSLNAWAQQLVKRVELGIADKAAGWDAHFNKLIAALAETAEALHYGERARIKEFKEIVQVISEADKHRGDELRRLITALRESS